MATIGGWAMFGMTILFVVMTGWTLLNGGKIATQPFNLKAFIPDFSLSYFLLYHWAFDVCRLWSRIGCPLPETDERT